MRFQWKRDGVVVGEEGGGLASLASSPYTTETTLFVEPGLLALGAEKASVSEVAQNAGALHGRLEPLNQVLTVLAVSKSNVCQTILSDRVRSIPRGAGGHNGVQPPQLDPGPGYVLIRVELREHRVVEDEPEAGPQGVDLLCGQDLT